MSKYIEDAKKRAEKAAASLAQAALEETQVDSQVTLPASPLGPYLNSSITK